LNSEAFTAALGTPFRRLTHLRGSWAHHLAMKYGPHGYLDPGHYDPADYYAKAFANLIEEIERSKDTFIVHYRTKYDDPEHPPIWMTAEVMSLGQLSKWLGNLKLRADRQAIANPTGSTRKFWSPLRTTSHMSAISARTMVAFGTSSLP
jgi:abortive infection bacteriophage resistance protein